MRKNPNLTIEMIREQTRLRVKKCMTKKLNGKPFNWTAHDDVICDGYDHQYDHGSE